MSAPYTYTPSALPQFDSEERVEDYMDKLLPWLREEFEALHRHLQQGPVIERMLEAPRAPFEGMMRTFSVDGWRPQNQPGGFFVYSADSWWRLYRYGPFSHE